MGFKSFKQYYASEAARGGKDLVPTLWVLKVLNRTDQDQVPALWVLKVLNSIVNSTTRVKQHEEEKTKSQPSPAFVVQL